MSTLKVDNLLLSNNNVGTGRILEMVGGVCDGSSMTTLSGTYTFENVTAKQTLSTSYVDQTGSLINYKPPEGTKRVIYESYFHIMTVDAHPIGHHRLYVDGAEVEAARVTYAAEDIQGRVSFKWMFTVGSSADNVNYGKFRTWTTLKEIKIQVRQYGTGNEYDLHSTNHWDGSGTDIFSVPMLFITAIG